MDLLSSRRIRAEGERRDRPVGISTEREGGVGAGFCVLLGMLDTVL
jgi:hypothetical protein